MSLSARPETLRQLFSRPQFAIDLYQRDYTWTRDHLAKLMEDLAAAFERAQDAQRRNDLPPPYFIGPIILQEKSDAPFIVDGQQRVTTLMLFFMRLARELGGRPPGRDVEALFRSENGEGFILSIPEYQRVLEALWTDGAFYRQDATDAERAIAERYAELDELFPEEADGPAIAAFARWLIDNVTAVVIETAHGAVAYQMFETMNNRGQPLRPADLFRHYLLARIPDSADRETANTLWREEAEELQKLGTGEDLVAMKTVLQARYSTGATAGSLDALYSLTPEDAIDTALGGRVDFARFLGQDLVFYGRWYRRFRQAGATPTTHLEPLFFVSRTGVPHLYRLLLAPLSPTETEKVTLAKVRITATFLDILAARLAWSPKVRRRKSLQDGILRLIEESRSLDPDTLALYLEAALSRLAPNFAETPDFGLREARRTDAHALLARLSSFVDFHATGQDHYAIREVRSGPKACDVDSLLPSWRDGDTGGFADRDSYETARNRFSSLILAPKSWHRERRGEMIETRRAALADQSRFFAVLGDATARPGTGLARLERRLSTPPLGGMTDLPLPARLQQRQEAILGLLALVWDPARLRDAATSDALPLARAG